jgi:mRNA-degrading endonuclease YafQ of YafQ-DinJ toxin-antitoxin module
MDVRIDIEKNFDNDIKKLSSWNQTVISKKINQLIDLLKEEKNTSSHLYKVHKFSIGGNLDSSLYVLKINKELRIILTSEEDPLFNEHIITLLRVVRHDDLDKTFRGLAEAFNQSFLFKVGKENG